jgi:hypothetical protein
MGEHGVTPLLFSDKQRGIRNATIKPIYLTDTENFPARRDAGNANLQLPC